MEGVDQSVSQQLDERVISLKFDNKQFETAATQSMNTMDRLAGSISSVVDSTGQNVVAGLQAGFKTLGQPIAKLADRFSNLGIIGMTALQNLTNRGINAAISGMNNLLSKVTSVYSAIKNGGAMRAKNIANAQFQLEGLGIAWSEVKDDINYAVEDTAYGLDSAAKAAGQLAASGVKVGDDMKTALRGISGIASMTNSEYDEIAQVFERVAGQGRVMATDLNSIAARGINAASVLAKEYGVTEEALREMVSDGEVSFNRFAKAMDEAFGEHAKDANKTVDGVRRNINAAYSQIGEKFQELWMVSEPNEKGLYGYVNILNAYRVGLKNIKASLDPVVDAYNTLWQSIFKWGTTSIGKVMGTMVDEWDEESQQFKKVYQATRWMTNISDGVAAAMKSIYDGVKTAFNMNSGVGFVDSFVDSITNITGYFKILMENADWSFIEKFTNGFLNIGRLIRDVGGALGSSFTDKLNELSKGEFGKIFTADIDTIATTFVRLTNKIQLTEKETENLKTIFDGLLSLIDILLTPLKVAIGLFEKLSGRGGSGFGESLSDGMASISEVIIELDKKINEVLPDLIDWLARAYNKLSIFGDKIKELADKYSPYIKNFADSLGQLNLGDTLKTGGIIGALVLINRLKESFLAGRGMDEMLGKAFGAIGGATGSDGLFGLATSTIKLFSKSLNAVIDLSKGARVVMFAGSIYLIAAALEKLAQIPADKLWEATFVLIAISRALGIFGASVGSALATTIDKFMTIFKDPKETAKLLETFKVLGEGAKVLKKVASACVIFAVAVLLLVVAVEALGRMETSDLLRGLGGLAGVIFLLAGSMVGLMFAIKKFGTGSGQMLAVGAAMLLFAIAIDALVAGITVLSLIDPKSLWIAIGAIGALVGLMLIVGGLTSVVKGMSVGLITFAAGMVIFAVAIDLLVPSITALAAIPATALIKVGEALGILIAALMIVGFAGKWLAPGLASFSTSWMLFSAALLLASISLVDAGIAMVVFAGCLLAFIKIMDLVNWGDLASAFFKFVAAIVAFAIAGILLAAVMTVLGAASLLILPLVIALTALCGCVALITLAFAGGQAALDVFLVALGAAIPAILSIIGQLIVGIVLLIKAVIPTLLVTLTEVIVSICDFIKEVVPEVVDTILAVLSTILDKILPWLVENRYRIEMIVGLLIQMLADILVQNVPVIVVGLINLIKGLFIAIWDILPEEAQKWISNAWEKTKTWITTKWSSAKERISTAIDNVKTKFEEIKTKVKEVIEGAKTHIDNFVEKIKTVKDTIKGLFGGGKSGEKESKSGKKSSNKSEDSSGGESSDSFVTSIVNQIVTGLKQVVTQVINEGIAKAAGTTIVSEIVKGINEDKERVKNATLILIYAVKHEVAAQSAIIIAIGMKMVDHLITGIKEKKERFKNAITLLVMAASNVIKSNLGTYTALGGYIVDGLVIGVQSNSSRFASAMASMVRKGIAAGNKAGEVGSPSKATMRTGKWLVIGAALGISNNAAQFTSAMTDMVQNGIKEASDAASQISGVFTDGMYQPVIKPTVDLSEVYDGASAANTVFNDAMSAVSAGMSASNGGKYSSPMIPNNYNDSHDTTNNAVTVSVDGNADADEIARYVMKYLKKEAKSAW